MDGNPNNDDYCCCGASEAMMMLPSELCVDVLPQVGPNWNEHRDERKERRRLA